MTEPRLKGVGEVDPDFRRQPKTQRFCWRCQKDLKSDQKTRWIHLVDGGGAILHPEDEHLYNDPAGDLYWFEVGLDCAKKIGLEWTVLSPAPGDGGAA